MKTRLQVSEPKPKLGHARPKEDGGAGDEREMEPLVAARGTTPAQP